MIDVEKFYKIAFRYVGELNRDLVHHVFLKTEGKLPPANPEAYFYRSMMNELRSDSTFRKQHDHIKLIPQEQYDIEFNSIDPDRVQEILNELSGEGFNLEVKVFIEMANDSALKLKRLTGVRYESLIEIRNFVKQEVTRRYGNID